MSARTPADPELLQIRDIEETDDVTSFSCQDVSDQKDEFYTDLDAFLRDDALRLARRGVARTVVAVYEGRVVAYAALLADAVVLKSPERKKLGLQHNDPGNIPALKVGRLAVDRQVARQLRGIGTALMGFAFTQALIMTEVTACRLLTVDAYHKAVSFYEGLGFVRNKDPRNQQHAAEARAVVPDAPAGEFHCVCCGRKAEVGETSTISMRFDIAAEALPAWTRPGTG